MIIKHNIPALHTANRLHKNHKATSNIMEKLSSGFRINKAADDAAGLAISEKMRAQIRGLEQAQKNTQDGVSLFQTADGALNEITDALQRIRELLVQKNNDTLTEDDREKIDLENKQLVNQIQSIAKESEFNTIKLLDGTFRKKNIYIGSNFEINLSNMNKIWGFYDDFNRSKIGSNWDINKGDWSIEDDRLLQSDSAFGDKVNLANVPISDDYELRGKAQFEDINQVHIGFNNTGFVIKQDNNGDKIIGYMGYDGGIQIGKRINNVFTLIASKNTISPELNKEYVMTAKVEGNEYSFSVEGIGSISATILDAPQEGRAGFFSAAAKVSFEDFEVNTSKVNLTIPSVDNAIRIVSSERGKIGAYQNRLEHMLENLSNYNENLTAAESRIRDMDMAKGMMELTKNNIISQATQAMLTQANKTPEQVLQLLR